MMSEINFGQVSNSVIKNENDMWINEFPAFSTNLMALIDKK